MCACVFERERESSCRRQKEKDHSNCDDNDGSTNFQKSLLCCFNGSSDRTNPAERPSLKLGHSGSNSGSKTLDQSTFSVACIDGLCGMPHCYLT